MNINEQKYSINELKLLSVVWLLEHSKYYLYGSKYTLQTDHQVLQTPLKDDRGCKKYRSGLTRLVDSLLQLIFQSNTTRKMMGLADYLCRHPTSKTIPPSNEEKMFGRHLIDTFNIW